MLLTIVLTLRSLVQGELLYEGTTLKSSTGKVYVIDPIQESERMQVESEVGCGILCLNHVKSLKDHDRMLTAMHYCGCSPLLKLVEEEPLVEEQAVSEESVSEESVSEEAVSAESVSEEAVSEEAVS